MACEQFSDYRLPGLGSYLQAAADDGDTRSILLGIVTMIAVIVLIDQFVWRPVIAWAEKFKIEQVESTDVPQSWVLNILQRSSSLAYLQKKALQPLRESLILRFAHRHTAVSPAEAPNERRLWIIRGVGIIALVCIV